MAAAVHQDGISKHRSKGQVRQEDYQMTLAQIPGSVLAQQALYCYRKTNRSRLIVSCLILLLTLGVVGVGTWGLTDSIKDTNHQVDTAWRLVDDASSTVRLLVLPYSFIGSSCSSKFYLCFPLSQVQSIVDIANSTFNLLQKLSPSLRAASRTAVGKTNNLTFSRVQLAVIS